ncbi:hypothetical protein P7C71_g5719, partial [Lecanoromycetidae sp. Uapishka_2]
MINIPFSFALALTLLFSLALSSPTAPPRLLPRAEILDGTESQIGLDTHLNPGPDCAGQANGGSTDVIYGQNYPGAPFNAYWLNVALPANAQLDFSNAGPNGEQCGTFVKTVDTAAQVMGCNYLSEEVSCFRLWMHD